MSPPETVMTIVRIEVCISITVVRAVMSTPPFDRTLNGTRSGDSEKKLKGA